MHPKAIGRGGVKRHAAVRKQLGLDACVFRTQTQGSASGAVMTCSRPAGIAVESDFERPKCRLCAIKSTAVDGPPSQIGPLRPVL